MSKKVAIVSDTNCGITLDEAKELGIYLVTMPFCVDGEDYYEYKTMNHQQFLKNCVQEQMYLHQCRLRQI